jgi:hypothetical protein
MFAIKDLESIKNIAGILTIPFFSAAYVSDGAMDTIRDPVLDWLRNHHSTIISNCGWFIWFLVVVAVVTVVFAVVDYAIVWLHVRLGDTYVMPWLGFTCLTAGIFVLSFALPNIPKSPLNPLWHIALLCYGFSLIDRASK